MSQRRYGHEQFRDLFKGSAERRSELEPSSNNMTTTTSVQSTRPASPYKKKKSGAKTPARSRERKMGSSSVKSSKNRSGSRNKVPPRKSATRNKPEKGKDAQQPSTNVTTEPVTENQPVNNQEVQETTQMSRTVFENEGTTTKGGTTTTTTRGEVQLAAARIKERKLQWAKEKSPAKIPEVSVVSKYQKDDYQEPAFGTGRCASKDKDKTENRTIFENDDATPAEVKNEGEKLQWAPGALKECMSEPEMRKKKEEGGQRGAISDRPPRESPTIKPPRNLIVPPLSRTPVKTPDASTPLSLAPRSPSIIPLMLEPSSRSTPTSATGGTDREVNNMTVSRYIAPNLNVEHECSSPNSVKKQDAHFDLPPK